MGGGCVISGDGMVEAVFFCDCCDDDGGMDDDTSGICCKGNAGACDGIIGERWLCAVDLPL